MNVSAFVTPKVEILQECEWYPIINYLIAIYIIYFLYPTHRIRTSTLVSFTKVLLSSESI